MAPRRAAGDARSGANIGVVKTLMGHVSATMMWDLYGHLYDDDLDNVAKRLDTARLELLQTNCVQSVSSTVDVVKVG